MRMCIVLPTSSSSTVSMQVHVLSGTVHTFLTCGFCFVFPRPTPAYSCHMITTKVVRISYTRVSLSKL